MRLTSDRWRRVSRPSRPVPTSVPTSSQAGQGCPDRPDLFACACVGGGCRFNHFLEIKYRSGQLGQLGQANGCKGSSRPDLLRQVGTVGTVVELVFHGNPDAGGMAAGGVGAFRFEGRGARGSSPVSSVTGNSDRVLSLDMRVSLGGCRG